MTRFAYVSAAFGLAGLLSAGAVAVLHAQQAEAGTVAPVSQKEEARERLIKVRTEIELMQIEHEADRADLIESMNDLRQFRRDGLSGEEKKAIEAVGGEFQAVKAKIGEEKLARETGKRYVGISPELTKRATVEAIREMDGHAFTLFLLDAETEMKVKKLRASIEERKATFAHRASDLNRKALERDEAESRYKSVD